MEHFVSASCKDEHCSICKAPATHKLGEEIAHDDPNQARHNLTAYVCCEHFRLIFGPAVSCPVSLTTIEPTPDQMARAILMMFNTLVMLDGMPEVPFAENISQAVAGFNKQPLRSVIVDRLYCVEKPRT